MMASRLNHREHVIPALTDHLEDKGGVIGPRMVRSRPRPVNPLQWISPNFPGRVVPKPHRKLAMQRFGSMPAAGQELRAWLRR
jgi:hypothetical protein